jgi:hypothetical protein
MDDHYFSYIANLRKKPLILGKIVSLYADTPWKKSEHSLGVCRYAEVYIHDFETGIKLVQGWCYLRTLPGWYRYKAGIASLILDW